MSFVSTTQTVYDKYKNYPIKSITIHRSPVPKYIIQVLGKLSGDSFTKELKKQPYDKLFHLYIDIGINGVTLLLEKNEVIMMIEGKRKNKDTESMKVNNIPNNLTLQQLLENTKKRMGNKFYSYSASNNCQDFILNVLNANGINEPQYNNFVKQDTSTLFKDKPYLRKFTNTTTDIAGVVNTKVQRTIDKSNKIKDMITHPVNTVKEIINNPKKILFI
jgi:hypothetical protein